MVAPMADWLVAAKAARWADSKAALRVVLKVDQKVVLRAARLADSTAGWRGLLMVDL